jgi:sodium-coupled neutral amino acid transporter 11
MPLLVGLMDTANRRSIESPLPLNGNGHANAEGDEEAFLEELAKKQSAGGGMLDSIANMANSILGAGIIGTSRFVQLYHNWG